MAAVMETTYFRQRLRQMENMTHQQNNSTLGQCDCTSYSYFVLSLVLFAVGTVITVLAVGDAHDYIFYSLGHMWLVGPIFICSGLMVAVKSVLYLRKKYLIQMLLRQRALLRELAHQSRRHPEYVTRNASTITLPPPYESLLAATPPTTSTASSSQQGTACGVASSSGATHNEEAPPPTYEEAMFLIGDEKLLKVMLEEELKSNRSQLAHHSGKEGNCSSYPASPSKP
ncbi:hypothetical protein B566_EDAN003859 [Ephemera danica]|nr:hypothetical protein B566_EDAN003859 [Ephemera danica]